MKTLKTENLGGQPLFLDDLRWLQSGNSLSANALLKAINSSPTEIFILYGCEVVGANITEGAVCFNGEIYRVLAQSNPAGVLDVWEQYTTFDPAGTTVFQDGLTHEIYEEKFFRLIAGPVVGLQAFEGTRNVTDVLREVITLNINGGNITKPEWIELFDITTIAGGLFADAREYVGNAFLDIDSVVHFKGSIVIEDGPLQVMFTLPVDYRPQQICYFTCVMDDGALDYQVGMIQVKPNGQVINFSSVAYATVYYLDTITFRTI